MRFKVLIILFFASLGNAFGQGNSIYQIAPMAVCWNTPENVDSNLVAYWLFSSRETTPKVVSYLTASGTAVVVAGGTVQNGFCCCSGSQDTLGIEINGDTLILTQNGETYTYIGGGGSDDDWRWVDTGADETMYEAIYRMGKVSIFTEDTTHALRLDSTYRFTTDAGTSFFEWLRGTEGILDYKTLMFRAPGGATGSPQNDANNITIARTNTTTTRTNLGSIKFAAPYTGGGGAYRVGAQISALDETGGNDTTGVLLDFWTRKLGESFMRNTMTLQGDGRLELDRYNLFQDGIPERLMGYENTDKDATVHDIDGNALPGNVMGINSAGTRMEWLDPDTLSTFWLKPALEAGDVEINSGLNYLKFLNSGTGTWYAHNEVYAEGDFFLFSAGQLNLEADGPMDIFADDELLLQADYISYRNNIPSAGAVFRMREGSTNGTNYITVEAPPSLTINPLFRYPSTNGTSGQYLQTDGTGITSWVTVTTPTTLYSGNGSLSSARTVTGNTNSLTYTFAQTGNGFNIQRARSGTNPGYVTLLDLQGCRNGGSNIEGGTIRFSTDSAPSPLGEIRAQKYTGAQQDRELSLHVYNNDASAFGEGINIRPGASFGTTEVTISGAYPLPVATGVGCLYNDGTTTSWSVFPDDSPMNEGSLTVGAGTGTTSVINSNTFGSTPVTIAVSGGLAISEAGSTITIAPEAVTSDTVVLNGSWVNIGANKLRVHERLGWVSIQGYIRGGTIGTSLPGSPDIELPFGGFLVSNGFQCIANDDGILKSVAVQDINGDLSFQSLSGGSIDLSGGSDYLFFSITYYNP